VLVSRNNVSDLFNLVWICLPIWLAKVGNGEINEVFAGKKEKYVIAG